MNVTREVVADLLPAYLAGEASADTRTLVEEFARQDADFARLLETQRREVTAGSQAIRQPGSALPADHELKTLARTRGMAGRLRWHLAFAILFTMLPFSTTFEGDRILFLIVRDAPSLAMACWVAAAGFWFAFLFTRRKLRTIGL